MSKVLLGTLILACIFAVSLAAQDQDEQSDIEVVITASRVKEPAEEVPAYVSVITAEELSASGQTTLVDALDGLAGIHFRSSSGNAAQAEISMRGFGENSFGRVLVLVDGRRLNRPDMASINWLEIPVENIKRVEVVRGGSSVLYGDNAVAGVINIITKKGAAGFDMAVSTQYGSFNQNQLGAEVSGSNDLLSFSLTSEHTAADGYRDRSAFRSTAVGGSLGLDLEHLSSSLSLSYNRVFSELPGALTKAEFDDDPTQAANQADEATSDYFDADLSFSFNPTDRVLLDASAGYRMSFIRSDFPSYFTPTYTDLTLQSVGLTPKVDIETPLLAGNRLVIGVDAYYDRAEVKTYPDIGRDTSTLETQVSKATLGAYAADNLEFCKSLSANVGLRYELAQISAETLKTSGTPIDDAKFHQALVYDIGLLFMPLSETKIWTKYGTVFRYPFVDEQVSMYGFGSDKFYSDLEPERGYNVEVGFEIRPSSSLKWVVSGYLLDMTNEIVPDPLTFAQVNLDKTRHLGIETEVALSMPKRVAFSASYALSLSTFREGDNKGNIVPLVPNHKAGADLTLQLPLDFTLGVSGEYVSEQFTGGDDENVLDKLAAYFLMGAFIHYQPESVSGDLDVYFGVDNLLDTVYATTGYSGTYYPGQGRSWKVGGSYRY